ncbi:hypothetical protein [Spongiivirga citrea]|uniref:Uncharacterized protein n=1 Tax=Spongiivirga citrea TaxID=1481457 RepID=A0A6M0CR23_9FLAO|nr:hypothetical protein [Spongiivirga citrea]NER18309.1 hypothetical protein [Spongiivirga citrea]
MRKTLLKGTIYSVFLFATISFITVLNSVNSPITGYDNDGELAIGFPFRYYHEFIVDCPDTNWGWFPENLTLDILICWIFVNGFLVLREKGGKK